MITSKEWANQRVQWGVPICKHQAIQIKLASMAAHTFAMESVSLLTANFTDFENADIRLEAAMSKYFGSEQSWKIADDTLQIRGGRGFETAASLRARGETPFPVERLLRDLRINRIIEGTSEIMQLFIAREAMDVHIKHIMPILNPKASLMTRVRSFVNAFLFYCGWYPKQWIHFPQFYKAQFLSRKNRLHVYYIATTSKKLARDLFHTMAKYQTRLEREQLLLGHFVDIGTDLFAMAASLSHLESLLSERKEDSHLQNLVDLFCREARTRIHQHFKKIKSTPKSLIQDVSQSLCDGHYDGLTTGIMQPESIDTHSK